MTEATVPAHPRPDQASLADGPDPCLGVLFVHGAGDHGVGATLLEFGEPLVAWLDGWLSKGKQATTASGDVARAGAAQIHVREADASAPAHSRVSLCSGRDGQQHVWLLAEARWDEAFTPPAFRQVLLWAIGVVPWTLLTQFIGPSVDDSLRLRPTIFSILRFYWDIVVSTVLALVASVVLLAVALLTVALSIVPLDPVKDVVGKLQRFASSAVGDLYLVLTSPIQRAALASAVQRDIDWLRDVKKCEKVAVIAHSQGGYVAYQALSDPWFRPVDSFITFGSGLVRLTESDQARRRGFLPVALVGVLGALLVVRFAGTALGGALGFADKHQATGLVFFVGFLMAFGIPLAVRRYLRDREPVSDIPARPAWTDYVTDEDPVLNGSRVGRLPERVKKVRIRNRASVVGDHSSYWQNADQFVARVAIKLGSLDRNLALLIAGPKSDSKRAKQFLEATWNRRDERVAVLRAVRGPLAIATVLLLVARSGELAGLGASVAGWFTWVPPQLVDWLPETIGSILPIAGSHLAVVGAVVVILVSALGYRIGVSAWESWSRADTARQWRGLRTNRRSQPAIAFFAWTAIHVALIAMVLSVGFGALENGVGHVWDAKDMIVQAWTRLYVVSALLGIAAWLGLTALSSFRSRRWRLSKRRAASVALGGTTLAIAVELPLAVARPGATEAGWAVLLGALFELGGLLIAGFVMPPVSRRIRAVVGWAQEFVARSPRRGLVATRMDRLGVVGVVATWLGAVLVVQPPANAFGVGIALAAVGLSFTFLMASNRTPRRQIRLAPFLAVARESPWELRWAGWAGLVASLLVLGVGLFRLVARFG